METPVRLDRTLIRVSGADARSFLQGLLTQDLDRLDAAGVLYAALLSPQGKLIADMFLWGQSDGGVLIDADPARGAELLRRLLLYKLRAQVNIETVSGQAAVLMSDAPFASAIADPRLPALGWRAIAESAGTASPGDAWLLARRIASGVPDLAIDAAPEEVFALEALLEELHGVDFQKGCFVGQENVSRMKRRATTRRKFCPLVFDGPAPAPGTPVRAGEAEIGTMRSGIAGHALALLRLDRAIGAARLEAGGRDVRLAPPDWLILPQAEPQ